MGIKTVILGRVKSIGYALQGIRTIIMEEPNAIIHSFISLIVIIAAFYFEVSNTEWIVLLIVIGFVFALEIINTAIENLCDFITEVKNEEIKKIKDLSAAAVLIASIIAVIIGCIIFIPKIITILGF